MVVQSIKIQNKYLKTQKFLESLELSKKMQKHTNLENIKDRYQDYLELLQIFASIKKSNHGTMVDLNKSFYTLERKKENLVKPKNLKSKLGFIFFKKTKRNTCISVCNSRAQVKAVLSIGHLRVNKLKLKVKARKATYNLKKLSYILGSLVYKAGFRDLYLKFKNDFPKKESQIFYNIFKSNKKFKLIIISRYGAKPHNGCRRPKIRRK